MPLNESQVTNGVSKWTRWWVGQRKIKLREQLSETMTINPLMLPVIFELHALKTFDELAELFIAGHLMVGHNTGFGKLIDEKVLPEVFGTVKLDAKYRKGNRPINESCFDEIDHVVPRGTDVPDLLSLKASKWTIQLTMAVQLNASFNEILSNYGNRYGKIIVGVFYGKKEGLTDKYDILRGINRGKRHNVTDLTGRVMVYSGREFWSWLNGGETRTQDWVLDGILKGVKEDNSWGECGKLLSDFKSEIKKKFSGHMQKDGSIDWHSLLKSISG